MVRILKVELERAFRSKGMTLALIVGYSFVILHFFKVVYPASKNILMMYNGNISGRLRSIYDDSYLYEDRTPYKEIFLYLIPVLSTLPFGASYFSDRKKGYIKNICTRCKKSCYLLAKYIAVFISGGLCVALPVIVSQLMAGAVLPAVTPAPTGYHTYRGPMMFGSLYFTHPFLHFLLYVLLYFLFGGVFASIALAVSRWFDYAFFVMIMPFAVYYGLGVIAPYTRSEIFGFVSPRYFLKTPPGFAVNAVGCFALLGTVWLLSFIVYWIGGMKRDIL